MIFFSRTTFYDSEESMPKPEARFLTPDEFDRWDRFVDQSPEGTIFHTSPWITTVAHFLNLQYAIIGVFIKTILSGDVVFTCMKNSIFTNTGRAMYTCLPTGDCFLILEK